MNGLAAAGLVVLALAQVGCGKTNAGTAHPGPGSSSNPSAGTGGGAAVAGNAGAGGHGVLEDPEACTAPHPGPAPLGRLGNDELNRSLLAFVPASADQSRLRWLPETPWDNDPATQPSSVSLGLAHQLAHDIAQMLIDDESSDGWLAGCDVESAGEAACRETLTESLLERAYRRALTDDDRADMAEVFATGQKLGGDFKSGMRAVAEVALMSPELTYLVELGNGRSKGDAVELTGYESAARLSYFLTGSAPDSELFKAAKQDALGPDQLEVQAMRLLGSSENRSAVSRFYSELLGLHSITDHAELGFTAELAQSATAGSRRFIEDVTFDGAGTFAALLTEPSTWVDGPLASFYGYSGVTGSALQKVQLDAKRSAGLFTQAAFLTRYSHGDYTSPVQRGLTILRQVLCYDPPPPPPGVVQAIEPQLPEPATMRERLAAATAPAPCHDCHRDIDPIGFAFEHYDAVGKWRDVDNGLPIDSSGELYRTDAQGPFADAVELMHRIAESDDAQACFVSQWLEHAYRRAEVPEDACTKAELTQVFQESGGRIPTLLAALARTDNFRYRLKSELAP